MADITLKEGTTTEYEAINMLRGGSVMVGGSDPSKVIPNINISHSFEHQHGTEQIFLNINRSDGVSVAGAESYNNGILVVPSEDGITRDAFWIGPDSNMEWDVDILERPKTNVLNWRLTHTEGLEFHYQPPLTKQEIANGHKRPDNVVGSYAVYVNDSGHYKNKSGETLINYQSGKVCHIYRPYALDAGGDWVWCDLTIVNGEMTVVIPEDWLYDKSRMYPVTLDPAIGYDSVGASSFSALNSYADIQRVATAVAGCTLRKMYVYAAIASGAKVGLGIYDIPASTQPPVNLLVKDYCVYSNGAVKWNETTSQDVAMVEGTKYCIAYGDFTGTPTIYYDTTGGSYVRDSVYRNLPDPWVSDGGTSSAAVSIYAQYEIYEPTTYDVAAAESITGTDAPGGNLTIQGAAAESVTGADGDGGNLTVPGAVADQVVATDASQALFTLAVNAAEQVIHSDSAAGLLLLYPQVADGSIFSDLTTTGSFIDAAVADGLKGADQVALGVLMSCAVNDNAILSDAVQAVYTISAQTTDGVKAADQCAAIMTALAQASEYVNTSDSASGTMVFAVTSAEMAILTDSVSAVLANDYPIKMLVVFGSKSGAISFVPLAPHITFTTN